MIELERTFLVKSLPQGLETSPSRKVTDVYYPKEARHPVIRLRSDGDSYVLTKKEPAAEGDKTEQKEQTIKLTREEFEALSVLPGKRVEKTRYAYMHGGRLAEIDVFTGYLEGLVLADFEFSSRKERDAFVMPGFCLAEVTQEEFIAGGMLCGKSYSDIEEELRRHGYEPPERQNGSR
jgi:CYTH domain-containing protein